MFEPKGELMQMVLTCTDVAVDPEDYLGPVDARWKAFRDRPRSAPDPSGQSVGSPPPSIVYGRWSIDGSLLQAISFLAPLVGMAAVVLHASALR
jgi:hypothetical protein